MQKNVNGAQANNAIENKKKMSLLVISLSVETDHREVYTIDNYFLEETIE